MSRGKSGIAKVKKYQTIDRDFAGPPKSDGRIPVVGEVIDLYETLYGWRGAEYYQKKGRYLVVNITSHLVLCEVPNDCEIEVLKNRVESYRIADFKAGLLVYDIVSLSISKR